MRAFCHCRLCFYSCTVLNAFFLLVGVGKSSLVLRFCADEFFDESSMRKQNLSTVFQDASQNYRNTTPFWRQSTTAFDACFRVLVPLPDDDIRRLIIKSIIMLQLDYSSLYRDYRLGILKAGYVCFSRIHTNDNWTGR